MNQSAPDQPQSPSDNSAPTSPAQPAADSSPLWEPTNHNPFPSQSQLPVPQPPTAPVTPPVDTPPAASVMAAGSAVNQTPPPPIAPPPPSVSSQSEPSANTPIVHKEANQPVFDDTPPVLSGGDVYTSSSHKGLKAIIIVLAVFLVGIFGAGGAAAAIAYGALPINNPSITKPVTGLVLGLPFMPKTPGYVLTKAIEVQKQVNKSSFDVSFATNLEQINSLALGLGQVDMDVKGAVDYSDESNVQLTLNGSLTRDFNFDLREKDHKIYIKVNQLPAALEPLLQARYGDLLAEVEQNWIAFDVSTLDTAARQQLNTNSSAGLSNPDLKALLDKKFLGELKLTDNSTGNLPVYKVSLNADDALVDDLGHNLQEQQGDLKYNSSLDHLSSKIGNLQLAWLVDKTAYYIREIDLSFNIKYAGSSAQNTTTLQERVLGAQAQEIPVTMVVKLSDFGQPVKVDVPESSIPAQQLYQRLIQEEQKQATVSPLLRQPGGIPATPSSAHLNMVSSSSLPMTGFATWLPLLLPH